MDCDISRVLAVAATMIGFGILGSYCSRIWDREDVGGEHAKIIVPGIAAAFVVPLFLSLGDSGIFKQTLQGGVDFWYNVLVIAGFSTLAGVSAPAFVNAVAQKALRSVREVRESVREVKEKTEGLENSVESVIETNENIGANRQDIDKAQRKSIVDKYTTGSNEHKVLGALLDSEYARRTIGGIAASSNLSRAEVRRALDKLIQEGRVVETASKRSKAPLYAIRLGDV